MNTKTASEILSYWHSTYFPGRVKTIEVIQAEKFLNGEKVAYRVANSLPTKRKSKSKKIQDAYYRWQKRILNVNYKIYKKFNEDITLEEFINKCSCPHFRSKYADKLEIKLFQK